MTISLLKVAKVSTSCHSLRLHSWCRPSPWPLDDPFYSSDPVRPNARHSVQAKHMCSGISENLAKKRVAPGAVIIYTIVVSLRKFDS